MQPSQAESGKHWGLKGPTFRRGDAYERSFFRRANISLSREIYVSLWGQTGQPLKCGEWGNDVC